MSQVRERPDRAVRLRAAAFAVLVSLLTVNLGLPIAAPQPAAAQQLGAQQLGAQQLGAQQLGAQQLGAQQDRQADPAQEGGPDDTEGEPDGTGLTCPRDPSESEDLNAGWWAEFMRLEELHQRVPEQGAGVKVAVLDTGTGETVQLAQANLATPIDLTTGSAQSVTDKGGFTWDCDGHGTAVAGLIAAQPATEVAEPAVVESDMVGVAPEVELQTVRVTPGRKDGTGSDLAEGIYAALAQDVRIINISIEMANPFSQLENAIAEAERQGVLVVAAAGNNNSTAYPAAYASKYDNVISVGSITQDGAASEFSSPSATTIAAPGEAIVTTSRIIGHVEEQGTSFAAPLVAGVAALMMNHFDGITPEQIRSRLVATADPVAGQGADSKVSGAGVINPVAALTALVDMDQAGHELDVEAYPGRHVPGPPDTMPRNVALGVAGGAIAIAVVALASLATVRRARTRGWRPGG